MRRLVEYAVEGGGSILVEVEAPEDGDQLVPAADPGQLISKAEETLKDALARVLPATRTIISELRSLADAPDWIEVEFGVKLTGGTSIIIASADVEANFKLKLGWDHRGQSS